MPTRYGSPHGLSKTTQTVTQDERLQRETELTRTYNRLMELMERVSNALVRETSIDVIEENTNAAPLTNNQGKRYDAIQTWGSPLNSVFVQSVGGGTLQVRINASRWIPVAAGDSFTNMRINQLEQRVTTGAAGTSRLVVAWDATLRGDARGHE